jgi:hypothetical protein
MILAILSHISCELVARKGSHIVKWFRHRERWGGLSALKDRHTRRHTL